MFQVDEEIAKVARIYQQMVGSEPKPREPSFAPIPPEANAESFVRENLLKLQQQMQGGPSARHDDVATRTIAPAMNVSENETSWRCQIDLPGVDRKHVQVHVTHGVLRMTGMRALNVPSGHRPLHVEANACRFERHVALPPFVKGETAEAKLDHGVLTVTFQKDASATGRDVTVTVG